MIKKIVIEVVEQANPVDPDQVGDWFFTSPEQLTIRVSNIQDYDATNLAIGLHELVEAYLCQRDGVKEEDVTAFDRKWLEEVNSGVVHAVDEPGDDARSVYKKQHASAVHVERTFIETCGGNWSLHNARLDGPMKSV